MALNKKKARSRPRSEPKILSVGSGFLGAGRKVAAGCTKELKRWETLVADGGLDVIENERKEHLAEVARKKRLNQ